MSQLQPCHTCYLLCRKAKRRSPRELTASCWENQGPKQLARGRRAWHTGEQVVPGHPCLSLPSQNTMDGLSSSVLLPTHGIHGCSGNPKQKAHPPQWHSNTSPAQMKPCAAWEPNPPLKPREMHPIIMIWFPKSCITSSTTCQISRVQVGWDGSVLLGEDMRMM